MTGIYWLIEQQIALGVVRYYVAPADWCDNVNLATKFHTEAGATAERNLLQHARVHPLHVADHAWG